MFRSAYKLVICCNFQNETAHQHWNKVREREFMTRTSKGKQNAFTSYFSTLFLGLLYFNECFLRQLKVKLILCGNILITFTYRFMHAIIHLYRYRSRNHTFKWETALLYNNIHSLLLLLLNNSQVMSTFPTWRNNEVDELFRIKLLQRIHCFKSINRL